MQLHGADVTYGAFEWSKQASRHTSSARIGARPMSAPRLGDALCAAGAAAATGIAQRQRDPHLPRV